MNLLIDKTKENQDAMVYRAADIRKQIKLLEDEFELLKPTILTRVKEFSANNEKYALQVGEIGTFIIAKFRKWSYSDNVKRLETDLKNWKKNEEADGTAKPIETEVLKFNIKKQDTPVTNNNHEKNPT